MNSMDNLFGVVIFMYGMACPINLVVFEWGVLFMGGSLSI